MASRKKASKTFKYPSEWVELPKRGIGQWFGEWIISRIAVAVYIKNRKWPTRIQVSGPLKKRKDGDYNMPFNYELE